MNPLEHISFEVKSNIPWQDTKIDVSEGTSIEYSSGKWQVWPPKGYCDGNGMNISTGMNDYAMPTANVGALIGRIGDGKPFLVGNKVTIKESGRLYLSANDEVKPRTGGKGFTDNDGSIVVKILKYAKLFEVSSNVPWLDTKTDVEEGTKVEYVDGKWQVWPPKGYCDGNGMNISTGMNDYAMPTANVGALIGRIGDGKPFLVGNKVTIKESGRLYLSANDEVKPRTGGKGFTDNDGSIKVKISN